MPPPPVQKAETTLRRRMRDCRFFADLIDARVETVIRALSVWKKSGVVFIHRDRIVLPSIDALRQSVAV